MASQLPQVMRSMQLKSNPIEKGLRLNTQTSLPTSARALKRDTALVKVAYSSLNPVDYKLLESPAGYLLSNIPAVDIAGTIVESTLPQFKAGDRVFGMTGMPAFGALAEYAVSNKAGLALAPQGVKLEDLATVGVTGTTAWQCVAPFVKSGDRVLINGGSGGVGTYAIQFAKSLGCTVTAVCSTANVELCKKLGADEVIDYKKTDLITCLKSKGVAFDHIFDTVFYNPDLYFQAHHYLKKDGKFVTIAGQLSFSFIKAFMAIFLLPSWLGGGQRRFQFMAADANSETFQKIGELMKEGKVKPVIESVMDLEDAGKGYARLKSSRTVGKIAIKVNGE